MRREYQPREDLAKEVVRDFPGYKAVPHKALKFYSLHTPRLLSGEKTATLRFEKGVIKVPCAPILDWVEVTPHDESVIGMIAVERVVVSSIRDLLPGDLALDGYKDKQAIIKTIESIWGITPALDECISIYEFSTRKS